jgi:hypothetical protein
MSNESPVGEAAATRDSSGEPARFEAMCAATETSMAISADGSDKSICLGAAEVEILMGKGIRSILHRPS